MWLNWVVLKSLSIMISDQNCTPLSSISIINVQCIPYAGGVIWANAQNISFRNSLQWSVYFINSEDKTKQSCNTPLPPPTDTEPVSLETYPLNGIIFWLLLSDSFLKKETWNGLTSLRSSITSSTFSIVMPECAPFSAAVPAFKASIT